MFSRSSELLLQTWRQCSFGKRGEGEQVGAGLVEQRRRRRGSALELVDDARGAARGPWSASGWAKIVRTIVATKRCALLGTRVSRLRMKCVRQRCQAGAGQRRSDRVDEAGVRVRGDELDAGEAARDQAAQEGEPGGAVLGGDDVEAEPLAEAVAVDADRVHDADVDRCGRPRGT